MLGIAVQSGKPIAGTMGKLCPRPAVVAALEPLMGNGPHYLPGRLILPLALIRDRPQKAALCPGQVCHFHDHLRPHPMRAL